MRTSAITLRVFIGLLGVVALGCCCHTVVGRSSTGPVSDGIPNQPYRLGVEIHGSSGHAYSDRTKKRVYVWIRDQTGRILLDREYTVKAAALDFSECWVSPKELVVDFFDYPAGTTGYDTPAPPPTHVFIVHYVFSDNKQAFLDAPP